IARSIVNNPAIVLADEPTGNLDSHSGTEVLKIFQQMNREQGITTVFVTHDPFVARHTDRIVMLRDGLIVADQPLPNPYDAGAVERPSQDAELDAVFKEVYSGDKDNKAGNGPSSHDASASANHIANNGANGVKEQTHP